MLQNREYRTYYTLAECKFLNGLEDFFLLLVNLLQDLKGRNVIGGDVVCLIPTKDHSNNITAMVAASIMFEIISLVSVNLKS